MARPVGRVARVEAAAREHALRAKHWPADAYRVDISGTDAEGNAVVTLVHTDRKSVQLRIHPKTYAVVREAALP